MQRSDFTAITAPKYSRHFSAVGYRVTSGVSCPTLTDTHHDDRAVYFRRNRGWSAGPLEAHLFYQIGGRHPDLNRNGIDDFIDILQGNSKDTNRDGVPDEAQHCLKQLGKLDGCEKEEGSLRRVWADAERQEVALASCEQSCKGKAGEEDCEKQCRERREKADGQEHELDERVRHEAHECREALHRFKHCEEEFKESNH